MGFHDGPLCIVQRSFFQQDTVRDTHLADIVHGGGVQDGILYLAAEPYFSGKFLGVEADSADVGPRFFILIFGSKGGGRQS